MANAARKDRKRLATTDKRDPTKESAPEPRAKRKRTSAFAEAPGAAPIHFWVMQATAADGDQASITFIVNPGMSVGQSPPQGAPPG